MTRICFPRVGRPAALGVALGCAGCVKPNPAFDLEGDAGPGATADATGTSAVTAGPTSLDPTTDGPGTLTPTSEASGEASGEATTAGVLTAGETGAETGATSTGDDTTTGEPVVGCWDSPIDSWTITYLISEAGAESPELSPDGLELYYRSKKDGAYRIYRATRGSTAEMFTEPGAVFFAADGYPDIHYPEVIRGGSELLFTADDDVYVVRDLGEWGPVDVAGGGQAFGLAEESHPSATEPGSLMLFQRNDGPAFGQISPGYEFYQILRDPAVDAAWPDGAPVKVTPQDPGFGAVVCPTMSPDGRHLFFAAVDVLGDGLGDLNDTRVGVWYARREQPLDAAWTGVTRSQQLRGPYVMCPTSVSADGCQLTVEAFKYGQPDAMYELYLASRAP